MIRPNHGIPADLWLFDCTYWSKVAGFVRFCDDWKAAGRLAGGQRDAARFVCVYRPRTQTEKVADALRGEIARAVGVEPASLVLDHSPDNFEKEVRPAWGDRGPCSCALICPTMRSPPSSSRRCSIRPPRHRRAPDDSPARSIRAGSMGIAFHHNL